MFFMQVPQKSNTLKKCSPTINIHEWSPMTEVWLVLFGGVGLSSTQQNW